MKLSGVLLKAGLASVGAGVYLYVRKLVKGNKKTKKGPAKNLKQSKPVKKRVTKPRQKRSVAVEK